MFQEVSTRADFPGMELEVRRFWKERDIFRRSVKQREGRPAFVFYEGPPTANGLPGIHHVLARAMKDLFPRYKTMRGFYSERKGGWDTHGLPVEIEVEKQLKLNGKQDIERYGVEAFNKLCRESVFKYINEWAEMTEQMGFWVDLEHAYRTYDTSYMESVWWILKQLWDKGLLYEGFKVVPYCPHDMTPLSSHELGLPGGYKDDVEDPSVYVKFALEDEPNTYFLAWTTTPWTLPGNVALAVGLDIPYVRVRQGNEHYILAKARLSILQGDYQVEADVDAKSLLGKRYTPLYEYLIPDKPAFFVVDADFVSTEDGTGIVHTAAAYGVDDLELALQKGIPVRHVVDLQGRFRPEVTPFAGLFVKKADPKIIEDLTRRGLMYRAETIRHTYPFCWRCGNPLIYYAVTSWFIKTTAVKDQMIRNNNAINWIPPYIKTGRMGNWLESLVDWSLSRWRFWGTPLPVWKCEKCDDRRCVGSVAELGLTLEADLHRPYIDRVTLPCEKCDGEMRRVPDLIDVWFDSGAMPWAQYHYPFENEDVFKARFPADFIAEGLDQTRGWFFSLLAEATMLFDQSSYKNVICTNLVLDKQGRKMSKSLKNTVDPTEIMSKFGADATRWYFYASVAVGNEYRFDPSAVQEVVRRFLLILWNTYYFFTNYARLDGFEPGGEPVPVAQRALLDRWLLAELAAVMKDVEGALDAYDPNSSARRLEAFVLDLSTWYVRRSRRRFWKSESDADKRSAYQTLYQVMVALSQMLAPFMPFISETIYRNLAAEKNGQPDSVHLTNWPAAGSDWVNDELRNEMSRVRRIVAGGLAARNAKGIKVRQPLREIVIGGPRLDPELETILLEELNIKQARYAGEAGDVTLDTEISDELKLEGLARDLVRKIQELRKQSGFAVEDRIRLFYQGDGILAEALERWRDYIATETLAVAVARGEAPDGASTETLRIEGHDLTVSVVRVATR
ncbi:MAG TPA: isoleucine--tRNA ligase [Candidatus Dormibacteraeota bacterium]|nr:isoleucine--tRNA ligase [Candidatus Dormibacteraeota bacterium]